MKATLLTVLALFMGIGLHAQAPQVRWAKAIGGKGNDRANGIVTDADGNIILVGRFQSPTITVDGVTLTKCPTDNEDVADLFILKLNREGKALWAVTAGDKGDDHAMSVTTDAAGNIYVVGWFESPFLKLGKFTLTRMPSSVSDMYVAKFSPQGECLWARQAGGGGESGNYSTITLDQQGNVVTGGIAGTLMDFGNGTQLAYEKGGMYVAKYAPDGSLLWAWGAANAECQGVSVDPKGGIFAGGFFKGQTVFGSHTLTSSGSADACIVKLSPKGKVRWAQQIGGEEGEIGSCETDPEGNVYFAGITFSKAIPAGGDTLVNNGTTNHLIAKFDTKGRLLWARSAGGNNGEGPATATREFHLDAHGCALCTGSNWSEFSFAGQDIRPVSGSEDIFLLKYDSHGNEIWGLDFGGTGRNAGRGITTDANGDIFLTGSFDEKALQMEGFTLLNVGDSDIFLLKIIEVGEDK